MHNYNVRYYTAEDYRNAMHKRIREWQRQVNYERGIVCSVPPRSIVGSTTDFDKNERWDPG